MLLTSAEIPSRAQPTNFFIGLRPASDAAPDLYRAVTPVCSRAKITGARRPADILHVSLQKVDGRLGRAPRSLLQAIDAALNMIRFPAFDILFDRALTFRSNATAAPFVLAGEDGVIDATALQQFIQKALEIRDIAKPTRHGFAAHATVAYDVRRCPEMPIAPLSWRVAEIQLIESWIGKTKYIQLGRWPLLEPVS